MNQFGELTPVDLDRIRVTNDDGLAVGLVGLSMTLYVRPWDEAGRLAFTTAVDRHLLRVGSHLRWAILPPPIGQKRYDVQSPLRIADHAVTLPPDTQLSFEAHSGERVDEAGHYSVAVAFPFARRRRLGFVSVTVPVSWLVDEGTGAFQELVLDWCKAVQPVHGYAGLSLIHNPNYAILRSAERYLFPLVERFPGLDYDVPTDHVRFCGKGIKSVNWLTVLSDDLLDPVGGRNGLEQSLTNTTAAIRSYDGGVIVQAGPVPLLGDRDRNDVPKSYRAVGAVLKPLRADYPDGIIATPDGIDAEQFAQSWLARFD
jgi:hypothetical protein